MGDVKKNQRGKFSSVYNTKHRFKQQRAADNAAECRGFSVPIVATQVPICVEPAVLYGAECLILVPDAAEQRLEFRPDLVEPRVAHPRGFRAELGAAAARVVAASPAADGAGAR